MNSLSDAIRQAFKSVPKPSSDSIVSGKSLEHLDIKCCLQGRHWNDISVRELRTISELFLTPAAFQFYLPAYLLAAVEQYREADVIPQGLACSLDPEFYENIKNRAKFDAIYSLLNDEQRVVIARVFRYLLEHHPDDFDTDRVNTLITTYSNHRQ